MRELETLRRSIPFLHNSSRLEQIHKGYSSDKKYIVYDSNEHPQYILRTYSMDAHNDKLIKFKHLQLMEQQAVRCARAIEIGIIPEQELGYTILSFVEGNEAYEQLPQLTEIEQFDVGVEAGIELLKINQVSAPADKEPWHELMSRKHQRYRTQYAESGVVIPNDAELLSFIDNNLHLMKDRPNKYQHDDFHPRNLVIKDGKFSGVIDFDRDDWGDPIHEFVKIGLFSAEVSIPFSAGQIRGYYHGKEPNEEFWRLYSLYLAMTLISSVVWVLKVNTDELDDIMRRIQRCMDDHSNFELMVPKWYSQA
ncbi:aminoglycoside phosphotransferase family protein [Paenibacillus arenosi]|uniref:Aminoglycoside phosphotransferase family protein n=1 Tax=Paenibacillus arenosi TaxID=2774142 RepID=A0ABR9AV73_9BACL|nr:aminoglycoside phosphotransferase family protein [Paenibacillus arenosi]MBD8497969.1 aminoglycoside phosphotransferase family protein [Paenibacillus arenosi]